jgi:hypothetical protein
MRLVDLQRPVITVDQLRFEARLDLYIEKERANWLVRLGRCPDEVEEHYFEQWAEAVAEIEWDSFTR